MLVRAAFMGPGEGRGMGKKTHATKSLKQGRTAMERADPYMPGLEIVRRHTIRRCRKKRCLLERRDNKEDYR